MDALLHNKTKTGLLPNLAGLEGTIHRIVRYEADRADVMLADAESLGFWTFFACEDGLYRRYNITENPAETDEPVTCLKCMAR